MVRRRRCAVKVEDPGRLDREVRIPRKDPGSVLPGLDDILGQPAPHGGRRDARHDTAAGCLTGQARQLHRASGRSLEVGNSQARALTSATTWAVNRRGRPQRARSCNPSSPCTANRDRHLRTVSTCTPTSTAMAAFDTPHAAASTIRARSTCRCGADKARASRRSVPRCLQVRRIG